MIEAEERGIDPAMFDEFSIDQDLGPAHAVLWRAHITTGPQGQTVTVEERLDEIGARYRSDIVTRFILRAREVLLKAGQSVAGSIHVSA